MLIVVLLEEKVYYVIEDFSGSNSSSLFLFAPKEQLIIENKIEQRLQIERRQLNDIRYNVQKKIVHGHRTNAIALRILKAHTQKNL